LLAVHIIVFISIKDFYRSVTQSSIIVSLFPIQPREFIYKSGKNPKTGLRWGYG
jgi:hypothetical protein